MQIFVEFQQVEVKVLVASHDIALISCMRHRVLSLRDGRLL